jgi:hypothetical protein
MYVPHWARTLWYYNSYGIATTGIFQLFCNLMRPPLLTRMLLHSVCHTRQIPNHLEVAHKGFYIVVLICLTRVFFHGSVCASAFSTAECIPLVVCVLLHLLEIPINPFFYMTNSYSSFKTSCLTNHSLGTAVNLLFLCFPIALED